MTSNQFYYETSGYGKSKPSWSSNIESIIRLTQRNLSGTIHVQAHAYIGCDRCPARYFEPCLFRTTMAQPAAPAEVLGEDDRARTQNLAAAEGGEVVIEPETAQPPVQAPKSRLEAKSEVPAMPRVVLTERVIGCDSTAATC